MSIQTSTKGKSQLDKILAQAEAVPIAEYDRTAEEKNEFGKEYAETESLLDKALDLSNALRDARNKYNDKRESIPRTTIDRYHKVKEENRQLIVVNRRLR